MQSIRRLDTRRRRAPLNALERGSYRVHLLNKATGQWFELQDLHVAETLPQLVGLSEATLLVYERKVRE